MGRYSALLRGSEQSLDSRWGAWAREVSKALDGFLWITMGSGIRPDPTTPPTQIAIGPTTGWVFSAAFNQYLYVELPLHPQVDRSKPVIIGLGWAPAASEAGRTVRWQLDMGLESEGSDIAAIDRTELITAAVGDTAAIYARSNVALTPAQWDIANPNPIDEIHLRISRQASGGVEPTLPGVHHAVLIQQLAL